MFRVEGVASKDLALGAEVQLNQKNPNAVVCFHLGVIRVTRNYRTTACNGWLRLCML